MPTLNQSHPAVVCRILNRKRTPTITLTCVDAPFLCFDKRCVRCLPLCLWLSILYHILYQWIYSDSTLILNPSTRVTTNIFLILKFAQLGKDCHAFFCYLVIRILYRFECTKTLKSIKPNFFLCTTLEDEFSWFPCLISGTYHVIGHLISHTATVSISKNFDFCSMQPWITNATGLVTSPARKR